MATATEHDDGNPPIHAALEHFDKLPDSATARAPVVAALFSISIPTVWRWTRKSILPAPTTLGGVALWSVGALRQVQARAAVSVGARTAAAVAAATAKRMATANAAETAKRTRTAPAV